jgi:hypothetical protein
MRGAGQDATGRPLYDLCDGNGNLIATGLRGRPHDMAGEFIVTNEWDDERGVTVFTYTLDGELIASLAPDGNRYDGAYPLGDYVSIYTDNSIVICDRELNILYDFPQKYNMETGEYGGLLYSGSNVLYSYDRNTLFHRTYLPDGTRLVTWYDSEMS